MQHLLYALNQAYTLFPQGGSAAITVLDDQWTVVTKEGVLSAQWEHMVLITEEGYEVLTLRPDEDQSLRYGAGTRASKEN